jgi:hypothetical protein
MQDPAGEVLLKRMWQSIPKTGRNDQSYSFWVRGWQKNSVETATPSWRKSSLSYGNGICVEVVGLAGDVIMVRDSKNARGAVLGFTPGEWDAFVGGVRNGEFDRRR